MPYPKKGECRNTGRTHLKKGHLPTKGCFQKGYIPWNKGKKLSQFSGKNNSHWKGGRRKSRGYILILKPDHPFCEKRGYIREHRLSMEKAIGRYLKPQERVHHINGKKDDNRIENLMAFSNNMAHRKFEAIQEGMKEGEIIFDGRS